MQFINDLNLKKQAEDLGVKVWETPGFVFLMMGIVAIAVMTGTFFVSRSYQDPKLLVISESVIASIIIIAGNFVVRLVGQMARLNKMKSEFVSVASHQLRTPLSAIRWETELLLKKKKRGLNEKQINTLETIDALSLRMTRLVNDLLDVARIDQKRLILRKEIIDMTDIIQKVIEEVRPLARARNVELSFSESKKKAPKIMADPEKIKLVVENLANNAIKYTTKRGKIEIKLVKKNGDVVFTIRDNGVGIPEEQHGQVFDKFFRSDNVVKYQTEGTGLGLYISKNIVEQLGGKIWFQSIENVGSIFSFSLPAK